MSITARPYTGSTDLALLKAFVQETFDLTSPHCYWHLGDVIWGLLKDADLDPRSSVRLWVQESGKLAGFGMVRPSDVVDFQVHPDFLGLEEQVLQWAEQRREEVTAAGAEAKPLTTSALTTDLTRTALVRRLGFAPNGNSMLRYRRDLALPVPEATLPEGVIIRPVAGEGEFAERVALHREVWPRGKMNLETYPLLRQDPDYTSQLDLLAVMPDGTFASYCICWFDPINKVGEFEPVGTHPAYRQQGLSKAVLWEGFRRLQALGAETAIVYSVGSNLASCRLYEAAGFTVYQREEYYSRPG